MNRIPIKTVEEISIADEVAVIKLRNDI